MASTLRPLIVHNNRITVLYKKELFLDLQLRDRLILYITIALNAAQSKTLHMIQDPLGAEASATRIMSPRVRLFLGLIHFCLSCIMGRYSEGHLFQKSSAIYCACFHLFLMYRSFRSNSPGGIIGFPFNIKM